MRIAVSSTHCCGKSTLVADFLAAHPEYAHEPELYEWLQVYGEELGEEPTADDFFRQLEVSADRVCDYSPGTHVIVERSPLDFVAYILALDELRRGAGASDLVTSAFALAVAGLARLDLLVFLPLNARDGIIAPGSEDPELREAANDRLVELVLVAGDDFDTPLGLSKSRERPHNALPPSSAP